MATKKSFLLPLDRIVISLLLVFTILIGLLIAQGDAVRASVRDFTWQNQKIGADNMSFSLVFSRPMDTKSVEENLKIEPPLKGKPIWSGRRMVYTLLAPAPYETSYQVSLQGARDKFAQQKGKNRTNQEFVGKFSTRDRVMVYIGATTEDQGRLVLYNFTQKKKQILSPDYLMVMDFEPYPEGDKILFSARPKNDQDLLAGQIYTVTTGIPVNVDQAADPPGNVNLMLDNKEYRNLKFDLSPDGKTIVVQRGKKDNPGDFGMWFMSAEKIEPGEKPTLKRLKSQPSGVFMVTPDSKAVAVSQGEGAAILPLQEDGKKPLDYLPQYGLIQAFSQDGNQAAMVKFNADSNNPTKSLFLETNEGEHKELLKTSGSIADCQFDTASPNLYCLITQLVSSAEEYIEQPYLISINLKTGQIKPLLVLPIGQRNVQMNLAPDGLSVLFDQVVPQDENTPPSASTLTASDGNAIASSTLWQLKVTPAGDSVSTDIKPEKLVLNGFSPRWLP
jgi:hypothetical protein